MAMELFDYVKVVFSKNEKAWKELNDVDKSRNFFMLNRFMSIRYPMQALALSPLRVHMPSVSNYWHRTMTQLHGGPVPKWIYAKTLKKNTDPKVKMPTDKMIRWYCEKNEMSESDFNRHVEFFGNDFLKEILQLEKVLKSQGVV
jgi:hypothetical protein